MKIIIKEKGNYPNNASADCGESFAVFRHLVRSLGNKDGDRNFSSELPAKRLSFPSAETFRTTARS